MHPFKAIGFLDRGQMCRMGLPVEIDEVKYWIDRGRGRGRQGSGGDGSGNGAAGCSS
jgi:hypothetical protein